MKKCLIYSFLVLSIFSCIEEFDLELDKVKPRLVIEGLIENSAGPHYIRLTKSASGTFAKKRYTYDDNGYRIIAELLEFIEDATVIVSDDTGQIDTLKFVTKESNDTVFDLRGYKRGYYKTSDFIGVSERTYFLKVITKEDKIFTASDYMSSATKIDSISREKKFLEKDGQEYYIPILYFNEPKDISNHYLISQYAYPGILNYFNVIWDFEVLSDKNLKPGAISIFLDSGASPDNNGFYHYNEYSPINVKMSSLSIEAYDYYKFILEQFEQDGGAYKPAPASPPTNISNGGLGFFQASASVYARKEYKRE